MRFHMGVSFNLRKLKKFIIPFLIGLASYFGLGLISCVKVNAIVQEDYYYYLDFPTGTLYSQLDTTYFGSDTLRDVILDLQSLNLNNTDYSIFFQTTANSNNSISRIIIYAFPKTINYTFNIYSNSSFKNIYFLFNGSSVANQNRTFTISSYYNPNESFLSSNYYTTMKSCFDSLTSCPTSSPTESNYSGLLSLTRSATFVTSTSNNTIYSGDSSSNVYAPYNLIYYYSTHDVTFVNPGSNANYYYRDVIFNNNLLENNSIFPTYVELVSPDSPDNPTNDDVVELKGLSKYVYWFFKPESRNDLLSNLYTIMFLYVVGYFTIKFLTIVHNTKWRN